MKKVRFKIVFFAILILSVKVFALETDISLYNDLAFAYNSKFFPGCVQYSSKLIESFPESVFISEAYLKKGESLIELGQNAQAEETLKEALKVLKKGSKEYFNAQYFLAKSFENQKKYNQALILYFDYCKNVKIGTEFYDSSILSSARILYILQEFKKSSQNFEYVLKNAKKFSKSDFEDSVLKLCDSYNKSENAKKTVLLYKKLSDFDFSGRTKIIFTDFAADAYAILGEYKISYDLYCKILLEGENSYKANALKKAYKISSEHKNEVKSDPGKVLQLAQESFENADELLAEFWIRLAFDALYEENFSVAENYFSEAEKKNVSKFSEILFLGKAECCFRKNPEKNAENAQKILNDAEKSLNLTEENKYFEQYAKLHIKYDCFLGNYKSACERKNQIKNFDEETSYFLALSFYNLGDYSESLKFLQNDENALKALNLIKLRDFNGAAKIFSNLEKEQKLNDKQRLNYAKILLYSGRYKESQIQAAKCPQNEAKYILALAQFNTKSWSYAEKNFSDFLKNKIENKMSKSYAEFYLGYSKYRLEKFKESYSILNKFCSDYPNHELIWNAQMTSANAAVQNLEFEKAAKHAEMAIKCAKNQNDREESVLLCSQIYVDSENIYKSQELLSPYSSIKNAFGAKCLFLIAKNYESQKNLKDADETYLKIVKNYSDSAILEEAYYRRGELYYSFEDFKTALQRFTEYNKKFSQGEFIDASWFYTADCLSKTQNETRAILQYQSLLSSFPESSYVYISCKKLMELYRKTQKIDEAIKYADLILQNYEEKAKIDGIEEYRSELLALKNGYSEEILTVQKNFEKSEKTKTYTGRVYGTELSLLFIKNQKFYNDGIKLAKELLPLQEKNLESESFYAAENAKSLADFYKNSNPEESAKMYLKSALYFKRNKKIEESASALYSAYSLFLASGKTSDAQACASQLLKDFPDTKYAQSIKNR